MSAYNNIWTRTFDPAGAEQVFNAEQAEKNRQFESQQAEINRGFESQQAQINRDFQERMSNTAYQRSRDDMLAAGLNPYAMYSQGGASTPSGSFAGGSMARGSAASAGSQPTLLGKAMSAVIDAGLALVTKGGSIAMESVANKRATKRAFRRMWK